MLKIKTINYLIYYIIIPPCSPVLQKLEVVNYLISFCSFIDKLSIITNNTNKTNITFKQHLNNFFKIIIYIHK